MSAIIEAINRLSSNSMTELNAREFLSITLLEFIAEIYNIEELKLMITLYKENKKDLYGKARKDILNLIRSARVSYLQQLRPERYIRYEDWTEGEE